MLMRGPWKLVQFGSLIQAHVLIAAWRTEYNTYQPHSPRRGLRGCAHRRC